jgi:hypothetical protein
MGLTELRPDLSLESETHEGNHRVAVETPVAVEAAGIEEVARFRRLREVVQNIVYGQPWSLPQTGRDGMEVDILDIPMDATGDVVQRLYPQEMEYL